MLKKEIIRNSQISKVSLNFEDQHRDYQHLMRPAEERSLRQNNVKRESDLRWVIASLLNKYRRLFLIFRLNNLSVELGQLFWPTK